MKYRSALAYLLGLAACTPSFADWTYTKQPDDMTGRIDTYAELRSQASLDLARPYSGKNFATLNVQRAATQKITAWLEIEKGQFVCGASSCQIEVRFGEKEPMRFSVQGPADYDSKILILLDSKRFVNEASKTTGVIRVRANIYQAGAPVMQFTTAAPLQINQSKK